ncbi:glycine cleavage system aminomethyltransferase GcvT [Gammaproteobacteria bacterium]|nr:glycine cleavage system aminomethyltransferase GcvT [Gammaproteobacteria bacterium]MDC0442604.1 glycine cleavage system aminomethyltransferase GcvT [Gammaproteobacteria bacterium]
MNKTPLNKSHIELGAKMVNFSNWEMPISYSSLIEEHNAVRNTVGIFDVSHMSVFDFDGDNQVAFFEKIFANDVKKIYKDNKAIYGALLNEEGGILDDLIIYHANNKFRLVSNCSTREQNRQWFEKHAVEFGVKVMERSNMGILAIQGPDALNKILEIKEIDNQVNTLQSFGCMFEGDKLYARTGYTGEDGLELIVPTKDINHLWDQALELGCTPIGLGARDTLRLEAGLNLYGNDMTINNHPYESNMGWTIDMSDENREFIGRDALLSIDQSKSQKIVGIILQDKGVLRSGYEITHEQGKGVVLSGSYSPTLQSSIGLARVDQGYKENGKVMIRNKLLNIDFVSPRFLGQGKISS